MLERDAYSCESSGEGMGSQGTHGPEKVPTETEADMRRVPGLGTKASGADRTMTDLLDTLDGCISEIGPHTKGDNRSMTEVLDALESRIGELRARTMEPGWEGPMAQQLCDALRAAAELVHGLESVSQIATSQATVGNSRRLSSREREAGATPGSAQREA